MDLPNETRLAWLLGTSARLLERGAEPVRGLVEPTAEFFPERPDGTPRSLLALFQRTLEHAGLGDVSVDASVITPEGEAASGCSSGGCAPPRQQPEAQTQALARVGDGYAVALPLGLIASPPLLGAHLARVVAGIFLHEADALGTLDPREADGAIDVAATMLGFGVMMANGAHVTSKSCGGVRVVRGTTLPVEEIGVALAIFTRLFDADERAVRRHLEPTPKEATDEGLAWARANSGVVRLVRESPRAIEQGTYRLRPAHGWLARTLGLAGLRKKPEDTLDDMDDATLARALQAGGAPTRRAAGPVDPARAERLARARAIVDESLGND